jgi:hypothetical protein
VGQETEDNCLLVSNFSFIRTGCDHRPWKSAQLCTFSNQWTDDEDKPELSNARRSDCGAEGAERTIRDDGSDFLFVTQQGGTLHRSQFFRVFQAIAESARFPADKRYPHVLKHSLASPLVAAT